MTHRNPALRHLETEPWASAPPPPVGPTPTLSSTEQAAHGRARGTEGVTARSGTFLEEVFGPEQGKNDSGWVGHSGWRYLARLAWPTGALHPRARNSRGPDWEEGEQGCGPAESGLPQLPPCQVWSKREALLETELASSTAGCFRRSQGPEEIRKECYTARCLSFERSFPDHSG